MVRIEKIYDLFRECRNISTDSRNIALFSQKEDKVMFFALKGDNFDGNKFVEGALRDGATYCISDSSLYLDNPNVIVVDNVLKTLQQLANYHRKTLKAKIIAVTGSNGKTTTKELLNVVLSKKHRVHSTKGNLNNHIGVPLTLLAIEDDCEVAIVEMGANHHKEIFSLCEIAEPNFGLITNIGKAHLEGFGSQDGVALAKGEMFDYISENGGEIFYDAQCHWLCGMVGKLKVAGDTLIAYETCSAVVGESESGEIILNYCGEQYHTHLVGEYNKYNIILSIVVGQRFGVNPIQIKEAIEDYTPTNSRSQLIKYSSNTIILDAYNANPSSMESALNNFKKLSYSNKIAILGDMNELGRHTNEEHINVIKLVEGMGFSRIMFVGDYFKKALANYPIVADWYQSAPYLIRSLEQNKIVDATILIKGSNSIKLASIIEYLK